MCAADNEDRLTRKDFWHGLALFLFMALTIMVWSIIDHEINPDATQMEMEK